MTEGSIFREASRREEAAIYFSEQEKQRSGPPPLHWRGAGTLKSKAGTFHSYDISHDIYSKKKKINLAFKVQATGACELKRPQQDSSQQSYFHFFPLQRALSENGSRQFYFKDQKTKAPSDICNIIIIYVIMYICVYISIYIFSSTYFSPSKL